MSFLNPGKTERRIYLSSEKLLSPSPIKANYVIGKTAALKFCAWTSKSITVGRNPAAVYLVGRKPILGCEVGTIDDGKNVAYFVNFRVRSSRNDRKLIRNQSS